MTARTKAVSAWGVLRKSVGEFIADDCMSSAAAIAYYSIFSLPPILAMVIMLAGWLGQESRVAGEIRTQVNQVAGEDAYDQLVAMSDKVSELGSNVWSTAVGVGVLLFSATGVLAQLQYSLNRAWEVQPDPDGAGIKDFLVKRLISLTLILALAFLLLVSTFLSVVLTALGNRVTEWVGLSIGIAQIVSLVVNFTVITLLFAAIFKILPDVKLGWASVWFGSAATAVMFIVGRELVSLYISRGGITSTYGTLVAILVWFYYSSLIVLFGAELTQVWARRHGEHVEPEEGAVRVVQQQKALRDEREQRDHDLSKAAPA